MDQFRGYTVLGMFVVNFLGGIASLPYTIDHHDHHFSYADSIMPSFLFAVGFSYRLSVLKRLETIGAWKTYTRILRRSLGLVLVSLMIFGTGVDKFPNWPTLERANAWEIVAKILKVDLWETLAIIGVSTAFTLPVIARGPAVRIGFLIACALGHVLLSYAFNYDFVSGRPNWMDQYWGAAGKSCFDGGPFGILSWSIALLFGTLVYDMMVAWPPPVAAGRLFVLGVLIMALAWGMSCLTRAYDVPEGTAHSGGDRNAASPVLPPKIDWASRSWRSLVAEPPFVPPPPPEARAYNFWMMRKRLPTLSFMLFASGFAMGLYSLFVIACDLGRVELGMFRTLGQNPLAAYIIHELVMNVFKPFLPNDSPAWWALSVFAVFLGVVYLFVRYLEREHIYLRL